MSWNTIVPSTVASDELDAVVLNVPDPSPQVTEQFEVGKQVLATILASGAVGDTDKRFKVALYGHANPNHEPAKGWANDSITLTVTQAT